MSQKKPNHVQAFESDVVMLELQSERDLWRKRAIKAESELDKQSFELATVQSRRDALAAQIDTFKYIREALHHSASDDAKTLSKFIEATDKIPEFHLREVKADAGLAGYLSAIAERHNWKGHTCEKHYECANQYADKVRQGG